MTLAKNKETPYNKAVGLQYLLTSLKFAHNKMQHLPKKERKKPLEDSPPKLPENKGFT